MQRFARINTTILPRNRRPDPRPAARFSAGRLFAADYKVLSASFPSAVRRRMIALFDQLEWVNRALFNFVINGAWFFSGLTTSSALIA